MALACCILLASCKKDDGGTIIGEDLSYLIKTYERYESGGHIIKNTWTYNGYKITGYRHYEDGLLYSENKNYSYNGLKASYDSYSYQNGDANDVSVTHYEYEYLDETFQRPKYTRYYITNSDSGSNDLYETYHEYEGKKKVSTKNYMNGSVFREILYNYDGLRCTYKRTEYVSENIVARERSYEILYLDETYLREKSRLYTNKMYDNGNLLYSSTTYTINNYDGKKPIGYQVYSNNKLRSVARDYQYDGLTCYYFMDDYQDGEVVSTRMYEVEYLE